MRLPALLSGALLAVLAAAPASAGTVSSAAEWKALKQKLARDLAGDDMPARRRAIEKLGYADWPDAVQMLLKMLAAPDPRTDALEKRFEKLTQFILQINKSVTDRGMKITPEEQRNREQYLSEMAEIRRTLTAVGSSRRAISEALAHTRQPEAVAALVKATEKERDPVARAWLVLALGPVPDPAAADAVRAACTQEASAWVRAAALQAMAVRGAVEDLPVILGALGDEAWPVRGAAVDAVAKLGKKAFPDAVEPLIALLGTETGRLKGDAADALAALTGASVGADAELWASWWAANKERLTGPKAFGAGAGDPVTEERKPHGTVATFYGIPTTSKRIAFVIDLSGSMNEPANVPGDPAAGGPTGGGPTTTGGGAGGGEGPPASDPSQKPLPPNPSRLDVVKRELMRAIWALPDDAVFALVGFHSEAAVLGKVQKATRAVKLETGALVDKWIADGGTSTYDALCLALALGVDPKAPDKSFKDGVDTVFLLSDGEPTFGKIIDPDEIVTDIVAKVQTRRVRIHTIWVEESKDQAGRRGRRGGGGGGAQDQEDPGGRFMRELAEKTGGKFVKR